MTETPRKKDLDALLREWPEASKSSMEWDGRAQAVMERLRSGSSSGSFDDVDDERLCAEPLGQIEGEGHNSAAPLSSGRTVSKLVGSTGKGVSMTMPTNRERDRRSLQDLAKLANSTRGLTPTPSPVISAPPSAKSLGSGDDSGIVDLAAASAADPQAAVRAQATPLASAGLFDDVGGAASPAPATVKSVPPASVRPSAPPASAPQAAPVILAAAPAVVAPAIVAITEPRAETIEKKKSNKLPLALAGIVAVSAIAASGFLFMKQKSETAQTVAAKTAPATPDVPAKVQAAPAPSEVTPAPEATLDPNSLPAAETTPSEPTKVATAGKGGGHARSTAASAKETAPTKEATAKLSEKDLPSTPAGPAGALGDEMRKAVGDREKAEQQAAAASGPQFAAGSVPQKPSQGAVTGAIGAVLPEARACLGPDDPVSRAAIVFGSEGGVQSVRVSGHAAGTPAEGCIKAALTKAKLTPFAESSYTANITVRH